MTDNARLLRLRAEEASAALRAANHATFRETVTVPDVYDLVGDLDDLVRRLPQLFGFLGRSVERAPGRYFDDRGNNPAATLQAAAHALAEATGYVDLVAVQLATTQVHLGHIGLVIAED
ncbi:hypothetical protein GCM10023201_23230 [Actinomycetospora corticicola]|uniref:Uncharacterized protein n=1 Tax=Actinomycetospora corticicola TaxID=663602 RepID=A0A7Y9DR29_9PSEU|nr:hypothetical protein [Actinomycetospora corticicola]NYD33956.1 hypothetical protein [Actinomycetospora corticicola]